MTIPSRDNQILQKIYEYCCQIMYTHDEFHREYSAFCNSPTYRNAIALCFLQIGELVKKLSDEFIQTHTEIPWRAIRGIRNVVAHEYGSIDVDTMWETLDTGIIELRDFCEKLLKQQQEQTPSTGLTMQ